jgi:hypothetical protein
MLAASVSHAQRAPVAINDVSSVGENGTVIIHVLANDSNFNAPDSVCLASLWGGPSAWATVQGCSQVVFHPLDPTFVGLDTFYYSSCDQQQPTLCDTGRVIVTVYILAPKAVNDTATLLSGDTIALNVLANDTNYNPQDSIRITGIFGGPAGWATVSDSTKILVHSAVPGYYGVIYYFYRSCDTHVPNLCDTGLIAVNIILPPKAVADTATMIQPDTAYIYVTANDSDFNAFDSACVTEVWGVPAGWTTVQGCGQIDYLPASFDYAGTDTFYYQSCYTQAPTVCDTGTVIVQVILPLPQIDFEWDEDSPCVAVVYDNSILADSVMWSVQYLSGNGQNDTFYNINQFPLSATPIDTDFEVEVCLTGYNPSGDTTTCYTFFIQCTFGNDGIAALASEHITVYPDPATDRVQIDMSGIDEALLTDISSIAIYDMAGRVLKTVPAGEINNPITVNDLGTGMYLIGLVAKDENTKMLGKFEVIR